MNPHSTLHKKLSYFMELIDRLEENYLVDYMYNKKKYFLSWMIARNWWSYRYRYGLVCVSRAIFPGVNNLFNLIRLAHQNKSVSVVSPQGSILSCLLFILCMNDLPDASKLTQLLLFADDTSIFYSHSYLNCLESVLNDELWNLKHLDQWNVIYSR